LSVGLASAPCSARLLGRRSCVQYVHCLDSLHRLRQLGLGGSRLHSSLMQRGMCVSHLGAEMPGMGPTASLSARQGHRTGRRRGLRCLQLGGQAPHRLDRRFQLGSGRSMRVHGRLPRTGPHCPQDVALALRHLPPRDRPAA
jgi:hypothetical protein